ncbi:MAG TPA: DUF4255 domain-containing protein, partial [Rhodocyclaceae bacterium]|nr:DUF4255 domain-containing protein [Rhodocyclaceae bacterium]
MAGHRAVLGVLQALKERLDVRMPPLTGGSPKALVLGSQTLAAGPSGENLGIYLHRIAIDPFARNRYLAPAPPQRSATIRAPSSTSV